MARPEAGLPQARNARAFFRGQALQASLLLLFTIAAYALAVPIWSRSGGTWLGIGVPGWFGLSVAVVVLHQAVVWLVWRAQLGWGTWTRLFGRRDLVAWGAVFLPFLAARPLLVVAVALADDASTLLPGWVRWGTGGLLLIPALYAAWSVARYFGIARALGGDHFRVRYREMPLVRRGAFAWTSNAMYGLVFLALWALALLFDSPVALVAALWQHAAIWAHYAGTEKPDMDVLYGRREAPPQSASG